MIGKLKGLAMALIMALSLSGCITMPDGSSQPDYEMIEFSAVVGMSVIVNETDISDNKVITAYEALEATEMTLQAMRDGGEVVNFEMVDQMLADALPIEYKALGKQGSKLIRSRVALYAQNSDTLDKVEQIIAENELTIQITQSVIAGMKASIEPKYLTITQ